MVKLKEIVDKYILEHPDETDEICKWEPTLLIKAVFLTKKIACLDDLILKYLQSHSSEINKQRSDGSTALMRAVRNLGTASNERTIQILMDAGADYNILNNNGRTALMVACCHNDTGSNDRIIQKLIIAGSNLLIIDNYEYTAFDLFIHNSYENNFKLSNSIFNLFVKYNAPINTMNSESITTIIKHKRTKIILLDTIQELKIKINKLETINEQLITELECHPDSEFVKYIKKRFDLNKKIDK